MELKPVGTKLLIRVERQDETKSGIKLVRKKEEYQEESLTVQVVSFGPDFSIKEIVAGTWVVIAGHAGRWLEPGLVGDENYTFRIIEQDDIIAYIDESIQKEVVP